MKHFPGSVPILLLIVTLQTFGQSDVKIKKSDFKVGKEGFKQAWDYVLTGDAAYKKKGMSYNNAFDNYIKAIAYNNSNPELNYKTGIAAIYTDRKNEASGFFLKALETKSDVADDVLLYTGRALQYNGRYNEAIDKLTGYLESKSKKPENNVDLAKRFIEECNSAIMLTKDTLQIEITNAGANINSASDDFSPVFTSDGSIYFASERKSKESDNNGVSNWPDENIFFSRLSGSTWEIASPASKDLITEYNECPLYIDSAEKLLYVYSGFENGGDIRVSFYRKGDWKSPEDLPFEINSNGAETSIAFSPSGDEVYFTTSSGKDNFGGSDIYFIKKLDGKKWTKPRNAGKSVNSSYDEQAISFSDSGDTLWFSSRGHNSIGGFDIFYCVRNSDGTWQKATNAGYPLNTAWDELFHSSPPFSGKSFYFASSRPGGFGGLDIYKGRMLPLPPEENPVTPDISKPDTLINADSLVVVPAVDSTIVLPETGIPETGQPPAGLPDDGEFSDEIMRHLLRED